MRIALFYLTVGVLSSFEKINAFTSLDGGNSLEGTILKNVWKIGYVPSRGKPLFFLSPHPKSLNSGYHCGRESSSSDSDFSPKEDIPKIENRRKQIRKKISRLANNIVIKPIIPVPRAIASILKDATIDTVDIATERVNSLQSSSLNVTVGSVEDLKFTLEKIFEPIEEHLKEAEDSLENARHSLESAKEKTACAIEALQAEMIRDQNGSLNLSINNSEEAVVQDDIKALFNDEEENVASLAYDDVGYDLCEMSPPFIDVDQCLIPGEAVVRLEKAPDNSRRIFAGIDIPVGVEDVWNLLTDYTNLQNVIPNLAVNEILSEFEGNPPDQIVVDTSLSDEEQCQTISKQLKGAMLKQVGGAKVAGINFSARTTLEVREWPQGLPDFAHFRDEVFEGKDRNVRANYNVKLELKRYRFPRPFALSALPSRDISMQSVLNDDGEFRLYQGIWRMQPLPGCAPEGKEAMRLTYAVEISPRRYLPVSLIEGRIVKDMCSNLMAIRDYLI